MLNAHNKNRPVKYLESLNNGSKHWYLLKNKQVYSFIRWSTTLEMCPTKKVNYTRKKRAQEKKGRKSTTLPLSCPKSNLRCLVVLETKQACWHEYMLALGYLHKCNKCVYAHTPPCKEPIIFSQTKLCLGVRTDVSEMMCWGHMMDWYWKSNRASCSKQIYFVSYQMTEVTNMGKKFKIGCCAFHPWLHLTTVTLQTVLLPELLQAFKLSFQVQNVAAVF